MQSTTWHNRIVATGVESPDQLLANPRNFRIHPKHQQDALAGVLDEVGWVDDVIVNRTTGHIIDGHLRVSLALRRGESVPVKYVELSEAEEALVLATFDPISALAATDTALLDDLLREVKTGDAALQQMLSEMAEEQGIIPPDFNPADEWVGMPEFDQENQMPVKQVIVSFSSEADVQAFAQIVGQSIPLGTKTSIWYPAQPIKRYKGTAYMEASDAA